jgi:hypothetical protein
MQSGSSKIGRALAIVLVAVAVACSWLPSIQNLADQQVDAGLKRAVVSFAAAKTLNAVISVAQGTEIALQPAGVGLTLTLGQVLDPLNDLVEQFATLMLAASVAFGVQKALLAIGAHWMVSAAVTAAAAAWALLYLREAAPAWLSRTLFVLVVIRFAIPVVTIGSDWVFQHFLVANYEQAQQSLEKISTGTGSAVTQVPDQAKDESIWERIKGWGDAGGLLDVKRRLAELQTAVDKATDHIIDLMVVFVMQTIIVPLVLLWALVKIAGGVLFRRPLPAPSATGN